MNKEKIVNTIKIIKYHRYYPKTIYTVADNVINEFMGQKIVKLLNDSNRYDSMDVFELVKEAD